MAKVGDTVRFLSTMGGGVITRIDGKMAYVEEDGFETPVLLKELVVVLPAGHEAPKGGARLMFDQSAYDMGRKPAEDVRKVASAPGEMAMRPDASKIVESAPKPQPAPAPETAYGDKLNLTLAFEPSDVKHLDKSTFNAVLVNDSNYHIAFTFLKRSGDAKGWSLEYAATVAPNELIDLAQYTHATLGEIERVAIQGIAYKKDKEFELKPTINVSRRIDLTKFHKFHCFRSGMYFEEPVLELPLVKDDGVTPSAAEAAEMLRESLEHKVSDKDTAKELARKYRVDAGRKPTPANNPNKLLPLIEVDLHIHEITDTTAGMEPKDMLAMQLDVVRKTMKEHSRRKGQKIVFIHGKGDGVLRKEVLALLKKEYPEAKVQDASFREYGFGASLVTV